jgi:hypothetical protein
MLHPFSFFLQKKLLVWTRWASVPLWLSLLGWQIGCRSTPPSYQDLRPHAVDSLAVDELLAWRFDRLRHQLSLQTDPLRYPHSWSPARGQPVQVGAEVWTSGFFPACLWQAYAATDSEAWRQAVSPYLPALRAQASNQHTHDLGFMIYLSLGPAWTLDGDSSALRTLAQAAHHLANRYDARSGMIRSWEATDRWQQPTIIDNLMNLELLFATSRWLGDSSGYHIAHEHACQSAAWHQRPDGSHYHVVDVDPATGRVRARGNRQGLHDESAWSRGQAWAIYGFAMSYRETRDPVLLAAARRSGEFWQGHLPADGVPYWDFALPEGANEPRDAAAGAIAAAGLLLLAEQEPDHQRAQQWADGACRLLRALAAPPMLAEVGAPHAFTLQHSTGNRARHLEVDVPLIYADYYFTEALLRYRVWQAQRGSSKEESP